MVAALRRHMTLTRAWLGLVMLMCLAVLAWDTVRAYVGHRQQTVERLSALAKVVEARTELTFQSLDLLLRETADQLPPPTTAPGDPDYLLFLKSRGFLFTDALTVSVVSAQGVIEHSSNPDLVGRKVGERDYLTHFRAHPDDARLFISRPATSVTNRPIIFTARAVPHADGGLRAVVVTGINPELLASLLQSALPTEPSGAVAIQNRDDVLLARQPLIDSAPPGVTMADTPANKAHRASGQTQSVHQTQGGPDGIERLLVMRTTSQFDLLVVVTVATADLLPPALDTLFADLIFLVIIGSVVVALGRFLGGRERQRLALQQELANARDYYVRVLDNLPVLIWRADPHGRLDYANGTLQDFTGVPGAQWQDRLHPEDAAAWHAAAARRVQDGAGSELEYRLRRHDGAYRWLHEIAHPFEHQDGSFAGHLAACLDVTDAREAQEKLKQSNAELEQFAYVASHDLREPLRMISSYMGLIERRLGANAEGDIAEFLAFAKDGATRMDKLILDLLQYSRIGRMSAPRRLVQLSDCLAVALSNLGLAIDESGARVSVDFLPAVEASDDDMVRLFQNLIGNAVKYAQPGIAPDIAIEAHREAGSWRFSVHDNGIGIDPAYFDRVFRIFQRLHGRDDHGGGSGIGLSICKKIVENHGGRIWVQSGGLNQGTTFYFTLPAAPV